jgi:hypothetical protein
VNSLLLAGHSPAADLGVREMGAERLRPKADILRV